MILLVQLLGWRPMVGLGFAAVPALAPELTLVLLWVPALGPVPELGARPQLRLLRLGVFRPALLRWSVRSEGVWSVE